MTNQPVAGSQPSLREMAKQTTPRPIGAVVPSSVRGSHDVSDQHCAEVLVRRLPVISEPCLVNPHLCTSDTRSVG